MLIIFIFSGVMAPLLIEVITLNGGCEKTTLMIMLPGSIGMCFAALTTKSIYSGTVRWRYVIVIAFLELFSQALILDGLMLAGSAIYTVTYSSVTIYTALLAYIFVGHRLHVVQWVGVVTVFIGLAVVSIGAKADGPDVSLGVLFILTGSFSHACTYVLAEYLLIFMADPMSPEALCLHLGAVGTGLNLTWQVFYTLPRIQSLFFDQITLHHGNFHVILSFYLVLTLINGIHALSFYQLVGSIGSVSTGVCKGIQSVIIFVASHIAFCSTQQSQCFTPTKAVSMIIVSLGVFMYSTYRLPTSSGFGFDCSDNMDTVLVPHDGDSDLDEEGKSFLLERIAVLQNHHHGPVGECSDHPHRMKYYQYQASSQCQ
jgi:drug/metabolite transporter (DMT)-like permease